MRDVREEPGEVATIGVAIPVPAPYGALLQRARAAVGDPLAASVPPHVTLVGPTAVPHAGIDAVSRHVASVAAGHGPFSVHLRGTGSFRPVSAVVFVQMVQGIAECERLERALRQGPLDQELRFNYHPHVTVAHDVPEAALDLAFDQLRDFEAVFRVTSLTMYEHGDDGVWRPVRDFALTPRPGPTSA